jgi:hypothetical protein
MNFITVHYLWHSVGIWLSTTKILTMKTSTNTRVILKAIDLELKALLQKDLELFKMNQENKQAQVKKAA